MKSFLDPFQPEKPEDVARLKALQEPIHQAFIAQVKARRGRGWPTGDLFTGEVWVGQPGGRRGAGRRHRRIWCRS